jgi:acid phosphatase (class A)
MAGSLAELQDDQVPVSGSLAHWNLPKVAALFERIVKTEDAVLNPAKKQFDRPRPYTLNKLVDPIVVHNSPSGAWPSGHTTVGTLIGIVLCNVDPEKKVEIMRRSWEYGNNRIVAGVHYRSDVEMGRISGSVIANAIMARADFKSDFAAAKRELRSVLNP